MSRKQLLIAIVVLFFTIFIAVDHNREYLRVLKENQQGLELDYADQLYKSYKFYTLDPIERLSRVSGNELMMPGTYIVGETKDENDNVQINPGWYIIKNEDFNDKARFMIDGNEYILGSMNNARVQANYVEVNLQAGQKIELKDKLQFKATRVMENYEK